MTYKIRLNLKADFEETDFEMKELYKFFKFNGKIVDIKDFDKETLNIFSRTVLKMISKGEEGWEEMLPKGIADQIKEKRLFSYSKTKFLNM